MAEHLVLFDVVHGRVLRRLCNAKGDEVLGSVLAISNSPFVPRGVRGDSVHTELRHSHILSQSGVPALK